MLKGLRGILEKGLQIAAPIIGGSMFGAPGAMFGSGIASLLSGDKAQDALIKAGLSGIAGYRGQGGTGTSMIDRARTSGPVQAISQRLPFQDGFKSNIIPTNFMETLTQQRGTKENPKPSFLMQGLSAGLPAYLSYLAAKEDAKKAGPEPIVTADDLYGGPFARPPEERRIQNLTPTYAAAGGMMRQQPVNGLKAMEPVQYSAATGQGIMGMAKGGDVFPRKTGQISGPGTKTSDSIPAMLSDGEFVQRTDAVNGAGVMMGAKNAREAREKGADFMYALQDKLAKMGQRVA